MKKKPEIEKIYSLSPMQEGMLFHSLLDKNPSIYFEQFFFCLSGYIDIDLFERSFNILIKRHDVLRTIFIYENIKNPKQVVLKDRPTTIYYKDISALPKEEKDLIIENFIKSDREKGFNLSKDVLMRLSIFQIGQKSYKLIWSFHHIIMDGWCLSIVMKEFFSIMQTLKNGLVPATRPDSFYCDYIKWLEEQDQEEAARYWSNYLLDYTNNISIPKCCNKANEGKYQLEERQFKLDKSLTEELFNLAKLNRVTVNIVFLTIWAILLQRYNNTDDVIFGSVTSQRPSEIRGIDRMVGLFLNTIPVRVKIKKDQTFNDLLNQVKLETISSMKYSYFPLTKIQSLTSLKQNLFDHIIVFENYPMESEIQKLISGSESFGFKVSDIEVYQHSSYDLNVIIVPGSELTVILNYNASVYTENSIINSVAGHFMNVVKQVIKDQNLIAAKIEILTWNEKKKVLYEFNQTQADYPRDKTIHQIFESQAEKTPNKRAIVFESRCLTYKELNEKANQLARILRMKGAKPNSIVGLLIDRSLEMVIAILGILKSGASYLPINIEYPKSRIKTMLEDSDVSILLTKEEIIRDYTLGSILNPRIELILIDSSRWSLCMESNENLENRNQPSDMLYVIYTSGSTGKPKGAILEHKNLVNLLNFQFTKMEIDFSGKVLQFAPISFDVSFQEIFSTLLKGGELHLVREEFRLNIDKLFKYIEEQAIEIVFLPTTFIKFILNEEIYINKLPITLKHIITAGEQLIIPGKLINHLRKNKIFLHNQYGPTETHVVTMLTLDPCGDIPEVPSIGRPISNTQILIMDQHKNLMPPGVIGELYISGENVGRGYLNRDELTSERFSFNPYNPEERIYRTGDLARWRPDGSIEYIGRIDHQVKIKGYRVELGEIENELLKHNLIKEAFVTIYEEPNNLKVLCAYIVCNKELDITEIKDHLSTKLPDYMVPTYIIQLQKMPLTSNGKIDRYALPSPKGTNLDTEYIPPKNDIEKKLLEIWMEVTNKEHIGVNDKFFLIGGDSFIFIRILARTFQYNWDLTVQDFYKYQTIRELANKIQSNILKEKDDKIKQKYIIIKNIEEYNDTSLFKNEGFHSVFLTGATGFLGIHILYEILKETKANIYCLVRGENNSVAKNRLFNRLNYYFQANWENFNDRIFIINGDITLKRFGLSEKEYQFLGNNIDQIIHSAALVKHYGDYTQFKMINEAGVAEVIRLAVCFKKRLNHISTTGIAGFYPKEYSGPLLRLTENDLYIGQNYFDNVYVLSKFNAENLIFQAMKEGLSAMVFRVGNLTGRYKDGCFQINMHENAFYNRIRSFCQLGVVPVGILERDIEMTPVDSCSKAIVKIITSGNFDQIVFHLLNHNFIKTYDFISVLTSFGFKIRSLEDQFFRKYLNEVSKNRHGQEMLMGLINDFNFGEGLDYKSIVDVDYNKTLKNLNKAGFEWPKIDKNYLIKIITYMKNTRFLSLV